MRVITILSIVSVVRVGEGVDDGDDDDDDDTCCEDDRMRGSISVYVQLYIYTSFISYII